MRTLQSGSGLLGYEGHTAFHPTKAQEAEGRKLVGSRRTLRKRGGLGLKLPSSNVGEGGGLFLGHTGLPQDKWG